MDLERLGRKVSAKLCSDHEMKKEPVRVPVRRKNCHRIPNGQHWICLNWLRSYWTRFISRSALLYRNSNSLPYSGRL